MSNKDMKGCVEELPCQLTNEEKIDFSLKLAGLFQQQMEIEEKKKQAVNEFGARLKKVGGEIHYFSNVISSGKESRNVKCTLEYLWAAGKKILTRLDTNEVVSEEIISDFERQQHMDFVERENGKKKGPEGCVDCGAPEGESHSEDCPQFSEGENVEETEQDEPAEAVAPEECQEFGSFLASEEACQDCDRGEECFEATPESSEEVEGSPEEVPSEPYVCKSCGHEFTEAKSIEVDEDTMLDGCPNCESSDWS